MVRLTDKVLEWGIRVPLHPKWWRQKMAWLKGGWRKKKHWPQCPHCMKKYEYPIYNGVRKFCPKCYREMGR